MKLLLSIKEFCALVGFSRSNFYKIQERARTTGSPPVPTVNIGRNVYIRRCDAEAWIAQLPTT